MKCLLIFSGGQDSTTCLGIALKEYKDVEAITFDYGQKHSIEMECAEQICKKLNVPQHIVNVNFFDDLTVSALTSENDVNKEHEIFHHLPASFVPNRNALFITLAHTLAIKIGAGVIMMGVNQEDYSGYPDCRSVFIKSITETLALSSTRIQIATPLISLSKAKIFWLADKYGILNLVLNESHTCYNGDHLHFNYWGYGCGECPACKLRKKGYDEFKEMES